MDLHEQTEKRINAESEQLGGTWEDHALRKWSYWQEAHRQRCEEIEKLQEKMRELELAHGEAIIQRDEYQKENSELRKGIEEVIDLCENGYSEEIMLRKLRSLVKKEVK
jgi:chromosome segregation ATPase